MKTHNRHILDLTQGTLSNAEGVQFQVALQNLLVDDSLIILSFKDVNLISSSFLNSSFGNLIDIHGLAILKNIKMTNCTSSVSNSIKKYVSDLASVKAY